MASFRVVKFFEALEENLRNLGWGSAQYKAQSVIGGKQALSANWSGAAAPAANELGFVLLAKEAGEDFPDSVRTQSHAAGEFIASSFELELHIEQPVIAQASQFKFLMDALHALRGQNGAPVELFVYADESAPTGLAGTSMGKLLPYGRTYVGGI